MLNQAVFFSSNKTELFIRLQGAAQEHQWEKVKEITKEIEVFLAQQSKIRVSALINLAHEKNLDQYRQFQIAVELLNAGCSPISDNIEETMANCVMECISAEEHNEALPFVMSLITHECDAKKTFRKIVDAVVRIGDDRERSRCATIALIILSQLPPYSISSSKQVGLAKELLEAGASIFSKVSPYDTALHYVVIGERHELLGLLISKHPSLNVLMGHVCAVGMAQILTQSLNSVFGIVLDSIGGNEHFSAGSGELMPLTPQQASVDNYDQVSSSKLSTNMVVLHDIKPEFDEERVLNQ